MSITGFSVKNTVNNPHARLTTARIPAARKIVAKSLRKPAHRVFRTGGVLHGRDTEPLPVVHPVITVGCHDRTAFVSEHQWPYACLSRRFDQRVARETRHFSNALLFENLGDELGFRTFKNLLVFVGP